MVVPLLTVVALAQSVPNGDFEGGDIDGWTLEIGQGNPASIYDSVSQPEYVMRVRRGGGRAVVCSAPFVVTREAIVGQMYGDFADDDATWLLAAPGMVSAPLAVDDESVNSSTGYSDHELAAAAACGLEVVLCVEPSRNATVYFDDLDLDGAACPTFVDGDNDGFCVTGQDVDLDGDCVDEDEFDGPSDCDDATFGINPAVLEICNAIDDNCDGSVDEGFDPDGDGWFCDDCDHAAFEVHPTALETCNGEDDDCDLDVDEGFDVDGDGWSCDDCDDAVFSTHPDAVEQCNGEDDDCNGLTDDEVVITTWWPDRDRDGYGDPEGLPVQDCIAPADHVDDATDCDDDDGTRHPGAEEVLGDGIDSDCDGEDGASPVLPGGERTQKPDAPLPIPTGCGCRQGAGGGWLIVGLLALRRRRP